MKIEKITLNFKKAYTTANGTFYIHKLTFNGTDYEYHSKTESIKYKEGDDVNPEFSIVKNTNRVKIKQQTHVPTQAPASPSPASSSKEQWLSIFNSLCTLKSGSDVKTDAIVKVADSIYEKLNKL